MSLSGRVVFLVVAERSPTAADSSSEETSLRRCKEKPRKCRANFVGVAVFLRSLCLNYSTQSSIFMTK